MAIWIIVSFLVFGLAFFYLGRRLIGPAGFTPRGKRLAWIGLSTWMVAIYASLFLSRMGIPSPWDDIISWIAYLSLGLLSFLFFLTVIRDLFWGIWRGLSWIGARFSRQSRGRNDPAFDKARRTHLLHLTNIGVVGVATAVTSYGVYEARKKPGIVRITVPIARLPAEFDGFRIVQITDVHAGLTVGREWIESVVEEVRKLSPDLIAFTGDMADGMVAHLREVVAPFAGLQAPQGKFFITGNHEYYSEPEAWVAHMREIGYDVLMNEHRIIQRNGASIVLAGVTDFSGGQYLPSHKSDPTKSLAGAPTDTARIFLAHQPKTLRQTEGLDFDLMISGHTHGGQFFPWNLATTLDQPFVKGLHQHEGRWVYVSKGTGYWGPPVRVGARSEITMITLTRPGRG